MSEIFELLFGKGRYNLFIYGYLNTLVITVSAIVIGVFLGILLSIFKVMPRNKWYGKILNAIADVYLAVIRGTPVLVQLMIFYFVVFNGVDIDPLIVAIIGFGINSGAYVAEIMRSGILSIAKGQMEAGRSLGLSYSQTMIKIILPQAVKNILPALGNEFIVLIKETSVASVISVQEFWMAAQSVGNASFNIIAPYVFAACVYLLTVLLITFALSKLEKRLRKGDAR